MLLSVLSVLIGAIITPHEYVWVYSTHICFLCLYLIMRHRFFTLFFVLLSLFSVYQHEFSGDVDTHLSISGQQGYFCPSQHLFYLDQSVSDKGIKTGKITLIVRSSTKQRALYKNVVLRRGHLTDVKLAKTCVLGRVASVEQPSKVGGWQAKQLYVERQIASITLALDDNAKFTEGARSEAFRREVNNHLDALFSGFQSWRFSKALVLGSNANWSERDKWYVRVLGLAHLFVVSGLHTGFVFSFGCLLSRGLWHVLGQRIVLSGYVTCWRLDAVLVIPLLMGYAYMTDWGPPVIRAGIMLSAYLLAKAAMLRFSPYQVVGFALWLILLIEPRDVLLPGLWLSFSLVCLLIGFCQYRLKWSRLIMMQLMLSTASAVLIFGWQADISVLSIAVNMIMIPFAAFIWFPVGVVACLLGLLFNSTYLYRLLDVVLHWVLEGLNYVAFQMPLISFDTEISTVSKYFLIALLVFWVWQTPLKRGWWCLLIIWGGLLLPRFELMGEPLLDVRHAGHQLVAKRAEELLLSDQWHTDNSEQFLDAFLIGKESRSFIPKILLPNDNGKSLSAHALVNQQVDWVLLKAAPSSRLKTLLAALHVKWVTIPTHQGLEFWRYHGQFIVRHTGCSLAIFLFKSDTCRHVETLEFMLN